MRVNRRRVLVPLLLVGAIFSVLAAPSAPRPEQIVYQRGYRIIRQEDCGLTLTIPKDQLPAGVPEEREAASAQRTQLRIPVWSDGVTTVYLDGLYYANERPETLYACFSFRYDLPEAGELVLPYRVDQDSGSFITGGASVGGETGAVFDGDLSYPHAVSLRGIGPGERIDIYLDTAVFQAAEGDLTVQVKGLNRLYYQSA